jgi:ribosomal protein S18 acetylase RimI-like enzyme
VSIADEREPSSVRLPAVVRPGTPADIPAVADAFRQMWLDNGVASEQIVADHRERVERFVLDGLARNQLRFFVAERKQRVVGTACCQLFEGLYPAILVPELRRYGYVWGVHVAAGERRSGLGRRLTEACVEALRTLGCTHVLLHAAPPGRGIYERLGFVPTNEMRLVLEPQR